MMKDLSYIASGPDTGGWKHRHKNAVRRALLYDPTKGPLYGGIGYSLVRSIVAWIEYAEEHKARYGSEIGDDYYIGPAWQQWGLVLRDLLNGETAGLDCGTLDTIIMDNLAEQGFSEDRPQSGEKL